MFFLLKLSSLKAILSPACLSLLLVHLALWVVLAVNSVYGEVSGKFCRVIRIKGGLWATGWYQTHPGERGSGLRVAPRNLPLGFSHWLTPFQGALPQGGP